jgi:sulfonate transport system substrate-binding protein
VIDFCGGGGTASIFAQAAEQLFVRVAREKYPVLDADAILVPEQSSIQILADLRGKRIAFDEGSSAHYVLVRALESAGIQYSEIEPLMLPQREVLPLFEQGLIDAWIVWMPYAPTNQRRRYPGRSIGTLQSILGEQTLEELPTLYYAIPDLVRDYPRLLKAVLEEVNEAGVILNQQRLALYRDRLTSSSRDTDPADDPQLLHLERRTLERALLPLDEPTLATLQRQANLFHQLRLIPSRVNVRDGAYSLCMRQNWSY